MFQASTQFDTATTVNSENGIYENYLGQSRLGVLKSVIILEGLRWGHVGRVERLHLPQLLGRLFDGQTVAVGFLPMIADSSAARRPSADSADTSDAI